ncbi:hypothetical protein [Spirosoma foliorum]|uniref:Uncharacterized protein n=1 Tax=Spirosoma foliorum TaxID=2710596 RepID=A0A7G5H6Q6_9BACT|nr:hypothetical protein [Spirosoma foliorum]QMW06798.1 hypothetical protein H3H32_18835 [Spirosoma foliorum]
MILSFVAIDKQEKRRDFWCQLPELEVALDVLSSITLKGETIINAQIIDEEGRIELPPEVFDGQPFSDAIRQLEGEWEAILDEPIGAVVPVNNWQIELTCQQLKIYEGRIAQFNVVVNQLGLLRERAEQVIRNESCRITLINHYNALINTYCEYINQAEAGQQVAQQKLVKLQGA